MWNGTMDVLEALVQLLHNGWMCYLTLNVVGMCCKTLCIIVVESVIGFGGCDEVTFVHAILLA